MFDEVEVGRRLGRETLGVWCEGGDEGLAECFLEGVTTFAATQEPLSVR